MKKNKKIGIVFLGIAVIYLFNIFAYEIENINSQIRNLITKGTLKIRLFDDKGLPISSNPNIKSKFISPFYVVHYGLIYSDEYSLNEKLKKEFHWRKDSSINYWNIPPEIKTIEYFKNCADWLVNNLDESTGQAHFLYNFDWPYKGYPSGKLSKPWWSGLTDAYAIVLMLRAYDVFKDPKYLKVAEKLYNSSLEKIKNKGSLTRLNDYPWIEEYVDPKVNSENLAFVLNGMIYSTFGIIAFEKKNSKETYPILLKSIEKNIDKFDKDAYWSNYDLIGNSSNMKYHKIHIALMEEMYKITKRETYLRKAKKWRAGVSNIGYNWVVYSKRSIAKYMYISEGIIICMLIFGFYRRYGKQ